MAVFISAAGGDAAPRGRRRAVELQPVYSKTAQNEIRVCRRLWGVVLGVLDSRRVKLFLCAAAA